MSRKPKRQRHRKKPKKNKASRTEGNMASNAVGVDPNQPTSNTTNASAQGHQNPPPERPRRPDWMTVFNGILAFFAALSFAGLLWQINKSSEALKIDQRAWVGITEVGVTPEIKQGDTGLNVVAVNSGKTPALNMYQTSGWKIVPSSELFDCAVEVGFKSSQRQGVLHPNARRNLVADPPAILSDPQAVAINGRTQSLYVFGKITYDDAFRKTHETIFCMKLKTQPAAFVTYSDYNDAN